MLNNALQNSPHLAWRKDLHGRFLDVSDAFERATGLLRANLIGRTDEELWPPEIARVYRQNDAFVLSHGGSQWFQEPLVHTAGHVSWLEVVRHAAVGRSGSVDEVLGMATERKQVEDVLRSSEAQFRSLGDNLTVGLALIGPGMRLLSMNRQMRAWFPNADLAAMPFCHAALVNPPRTQFCEGCPAVVTFGNGQTQEGSCERMVGGEPHHFKLVSSPMRDASGAIAAVSVLYQDVTQSKRLEDRLRDAAAAAQSANQAKSDFLAVVSHEIRTPLNGIVGMIELLLATPLGQDQRACCLSVKSCAQSLHSLVNGLLDCAKGEAGKLTLDVADFDLWEVLDSVMDLAAVEASRKGLEWAAIIGRDVPRLVQGDATRVRQIALNMLGNAIKFTQQGSVVLRVTLSSREGGGAGIRLAVTDTGAGIPQEKLGMLFQSFTQLDPSSTRVAGGTGLGLVISLKLAQLMGGSMGVESHPGQGSTFHAEIQLAVTPQDASMRSAYAVQFAGCRTLVVSGREQSREAMGHLLAWAGCPFRVESTAAGALELLQQEGGGQYQVVVADLPTDELDALLHGFPESQKPQLLVVDNRLGPGSSGGPVQQGVGRLPRPLRGETLLAAVRDACQGLPRLLKPGASCGLPPAAPQGPRVLIVTHNYSVRRDAMRELRALGMTVDAAAHLQEAMAVLESQPYDCVLLEVDAGHRLGGDMVRMLRRLQAGEERTTVITMEESTTDAASGLDSDGASEVDAHLPLPLVTADLRTCIQGLVAKRTTATVEAGHANAGGG